jgi:hypothetical protein
MEHVGVSGIDQVRFVSKSLAFVNFEAIPRKLKVGEPKPGTMSAVAIIPASNLTSIISLF